MTIVSIILFLLNVNIVLYLTCASISIITNNETVQIKQLLISAVPFDPLILSCYNKKDNQQERFPLLTLSIIQIVEDVLLEKKKGISKKESAMETKRKLLESADYLFSKYGFKNVSVDSIVERAGVAKGSFYVHFKSKNALIISFLNNYVSSLDTEYRAFYETFPEDSKTSDVLLALIEKIIDIIINKIGYESIRLIYEVHLEKSVDTFALLDYHRDLYTIFINIINRGISRNEFQLTIPADRLAKHFVLILRGYIYEWCIRYPDFDLKTTVLENYQLLLNGLKKQKD